MFDSVENPTSCWKKGLNSNIALLILHKKQPIIDVVANNKTFLAWRSTFMSNIKLNEQLVFLRKQNNKTQQDLAQVLNVSNQAVSKWESGINHPDINLLPEIAKYFNVSIDELLGYQPANSVNDIYLKIKDLFQEIPKADRMDLAYNLAFFACGYGLEDSIWQDNKKLNANMKDKAKDSEFYKWGSSVWNDPKGPSVIKGNNVFISSNRYAKFLNPKEIREIFNAIKPLSNLDNLRVLYALHELTLESLNKLPSDVSHEISNSILELTLDSLPTVNLNLLQDLILEHVDFVTTEKIMEKCGLPQDVVEKALSALPGIQIEVSEDGSQDHITMNEMYIPALLTLLTK